MTERSAASRRRIDVLVVLALLLPAVVALSLGFVQGDDPVPQVEPPVRDRLTHLSVACPSPIGRPAGDVQVSRVPGVDGGNVEVRINNRNDRLKPRDDVAAGEGVTTVADSRAATVLTGKRAAAPGLVAGRASVGSVAECREPWYDDWFVGLGAAARQSSVIELINPDASVAVVNVDLYGPDGPLEDASWNGVTIAPRTVKWVRLSERPVRAPVAARVTVSRGRISAVARHTFDALGRSQPTTDYVPAQSHAATENLLLGVPGEGGHRRLFLTNPGDDEVRATVSVVTGDATLVPSGVEEVPVPPRSQVSVPVSDYLDVDAAEGALGLLVESAAPLLAGARGVVDGDLVAVGPVTAYDDPMVGVLPTGPKTLLLGAATRPGTARISAVDADGRQIWDEKRFEVGAGHAVQVDLPRRAVRIQVESRNTPVAATVLVEDDAGRGVVRLQPARVFADVPVVGPAD